MWRESAHPKIVVHVTDCYVNTARLSAAVSKTVA
uniref:Uncharacterized protein n=1 Tax=Anguilla anguilla TaxID=7936 RepID=A0A0E9Q9H0_ANGAN